MYLLNEINEMPTLHCGHFDNLKISQPEFRVWLSRMTLADGAECNNQVTEESLISGVWVITAQYEAK